MNTLREALQSYLAMRRALGFKLSDAGPLYRILLPFWSETESPTSPYDLH
jgi:hypothetical protein